MPSVPGDLPDSIVSNASKHSFSVNNPSHFYLSLSLSEGCSWSKNKLSENDVTLGFFEAKAEYKKNCILLKYLGRL